MVVSFLCLSITSPSLLNLLDYTGFILGLTFNYSYERSKKPNSLRPTPHRHSMRMGSRNNAVEMSLSRLARTHNSYIQRGTLHPILYCTLRQFSFICLVKNTRCIDTRGVSNKHPILIAISGTEQSSVRALEKVLVICKNKLKSSVFKILFFNNFT